MRKFRALARLFRRTENAVIAELYTHVLNQPLFIEPGLGEQLLGAYMSGAIVYRSDRSPARESRLGVLEISGALASRPMPGPSGDGPQSYEEIRADFDELMDDASVDAVVLRIDSPGGLAAGLFDLTDHIYSRRGEKPIHAVVDDIAFSAAYGIAAAADQIWVSRTGGVGSVGVVSYHVDQSEYDRSQGLKITPIYAGARKIDFSPHFPLTDEAKRREQEIVDRLYEMFTDAVHRYRGLSVEAIEATEADIYHGQEALDVGFADRIGTLHDALAFLAAGGETTNSSTKEARMTEHAQQAAAEVTTTGDTPLTDAAAQAAASASNAVQNAANVTNAILAADIPDNLKIALLKMDLKEDQVEARLKHAKAVQALCATAKAERLAEAFVASNTPVETVRDALLAQQAAAEQQVDVKLKDGVGAASGKQQERLTTAQIYQSRQEQVQKHVRG